MERTEEKQSRKMKTDITLKLIQNKLIDVTFKKTLSPYEWAEMVAYYKKEKGYTSEHQMSREEKIPRSTLRGWMLPLRVSKDVFNKKVSDGESAEKIIKDLRYKSYDIPDLIKYFKTFIPRNAETTDNIKILSVVLMDCAKRRK